MEPVGREDAHVLGRPGREDGHGLVGSGREDAHDGSSGEDVHRDGSIQDAPEPGGPCPRCAASNPPKARFCSECGAPLAVAPGGGDTRKTVTILFSDVSGSTALGEQLDPEEMRALLRRYFGTMRDVLTRHGATVEKFIGDAVMAVFGIPTVHEDDALRAVRAATALREALDDLNADLLRERGISIATRTGINTGVVVAGEAGEETLVTGDPVNVAARLEQAASPTEILMGEQTFRLVRAAVEAEPVAALELKGKSEPVRAFRLVSVHPDASSVARRTDTPLVGREVELGLLGQAFERVEAGRICQMVTLLGAAGIGKSRLVHEFLAALRPRARVLRGRCLSYGEGITFWPVIEIVHQAVGVEDSDTAEQVRAKLEALIGGEPEGPRIVAGVATAIGLGRAADPEEIFWSVRRLLEAAARESPLVVVVDDLHWAEPTLLDLLEHITDWSRESPILLLCLARPELLDGRSTWAGGKLNATSMLLEALPPAAAIRVLTNLAGPATLDSAAAAHVQGAADGNPLFLEEYVAMLVDDGTLEARGESLVAVRDVAALSVPPSIAALLAARLERLDRRQRELLEAASVIGKTFGREPLAELVGGEPGSLSGILGQLIRRELIRPDPSGEGFRFRHLLLRDAAYAGLPKQQRAELHDRFGGWLERAAGERAGEREEIIGYHFEQAYRYRSELGAPSAERTALAARAGGHLAGAGRRALARGDLHAAVTLLDRALELLPQGDERRGRLLPELGSALTEVGDFTRAEALFTGAAAAAASAGDEKLESYTALTRLHLRSMVEPEGTSEVVQREVERLLPYFREHGDEVGLAKAHRRLAIVHRAAGRFAPMEQALERAVVHARRAADERELARSLALLPVAHLHGPMPVGDAILRAERILEEAAGNRTITAGALYGLAGLAALEGRFGDARRYRAQRTARSEEFGLVLESAETALLAAAAGLLEGASGDAVAQLQAASERLAQIGERSLRAEVEAALAHSLHALGRTEEALESTFRAEELCGSDQVATGATWRAARAKLLARLGETTAALDAAREAVAMVDRTDSPQLCGEIRLDQAEVLRRSDPSTAETAMAEAMARFAAKGSLAATALAHRREAETVGRGVPR